MCFYVAISKKTQSELKSKLPITNGYHKYNENRFAFNGFDFEYLPVITTNGLSAKRWGLVPHSTKNITAANRFRLFNLNSRCEKILEKTGEYGSIPYARCIIPCTGFFEWHHLKKTKYPHFVTMKNAGPLYLGAVCDTWYSAEGSTEESFSVITTPANSLMEFIHNSKKRMPLILTYENAQNWISPGLSINDIRLLMKPFDVDLMNATSVRKFSPSKIKEYSEEELIVPTIYPELNLSGLF